MSFYLPLTNIVHCTAPLTCLQTMKQFVWSAPEGFIQSQTCSHQHSPITFKSGYVLKLYRALIQTMQCKSLPIFTLTSCLIGCSLCRVWCPPLQGCCSYHLPWSDMLHIHQDGTIRACCTCWTELLECFVLFTFPLVILSNSFGQKNDKTPLELIEVPVKDLTFDQLQLLKVETWNCVQNWAK